LVIEAGNRGSKEAIKKEPDGVLRKGASEKKKGGISWLGG